MLTLRAAAALLAAARSTSELVPVLRVLGFTQPPLSLDAAACDELGVPDGTGLATVVQGPGTLRALVLEAPADGVPLRNHVARTAARLATRSPHLLWLIAMVERSGSELALAAWSADRRRPRVSALLMDRSRVVDSDAETLAALAAVANAATPDLLVHARWIEILGRDALGRRFYRALERVVAELATSATGRASATDRHDVALLYVSRLLFLAFLEAKQWLDGDREFLARGFARCIADGGDYHRRVLLPLFFGTLSTPRARRAAAARALGDVPFLNGGLFARSMLERRCDGLRFPDAALGAVFGELLSRYRFTAREDGHGWSEAAVDPEMLGRAFESLMAARERRTSGAFYTPQPLVEQVTAAALASALGGSDLPDEAAAALCGDPVGAAARSALRMRLAQLRVLDPACGSGAFLVHALEQLTALATRLGDPRPIAELRRELLTRSIFGVDVNATAVWLCELRLWLSVVIESAEVEPADVRPLPNLDHHIRVGDSLAGGQFSAGGVAGAAVGRAVAQLRGRYARATGARKRSLGRALDDAERSAARAVTERRLTTLTTERAEILRAARARDLFAARRGLTRRDDARLARLRGALTEARASRRTLVRGGSLPFAFAVHFADVAAAGGFGLVIGNPPWVRLHNIPRDTRQRLRSEYTVFRDAAWAAGAAAASAGRGFAAQVDLAALFVERGVQLLAGGGTLALLVPAKLWRSLAGGGVRRLLTTGTEVIAVEDFSDAPAAFDAAVYPSLLVARRHAVQPEPGSGRTDDAAAATRGPRATAGSPYVSAALHRASGVLRWAIPRAALPLADAASPWLLVPAEVRGAFDRLAGAGLPLSQSPLGRPTLGVKCGCNDAFLVDVVTTRGERSSGALAGRTCVCARASGREAEVAAASLRPLVRGEHVLAWRIERGTEHIVWTHDSDGAPLVALPPGTAEWLAPARPRLERRSDLRPGAPWWMLFRTEGAAPGCARVVWPDIGRSPRAAVLEAGDTSVPLNSCYVVACGSLADAHAFAALLNSPVAAAWLNTIAEPARGGYHRYLGWTTALLPIPRDWPHARSLLAPLGERAVRGDAPAAEALTCAVLDAFGLRFSSVAPLLAWNER